VGVIYAVVSRGTYQDDDLDHYYVALRAWQEPRLFIDAWAMPLLTLLLAVPAKLGGFLAVEILSAVFSATAALALGLTARRLGIRFTWAASLLFLAQPLALDLSYTVLAEPLAACLVSGVLWFWYDGRKDRALALAGLLPLVRIESLFLLALIGLAGWRDTTWRDRMIAALPLAVWVMLSTLVHHDPLYILGGSYKPLNSLGVLHYARNLIVLAGPLVLFLYLWAWASARSRIRAAGDVGESGSEPEPRFPLFAAVMVPYHLALLTLFAWDAMPVGRSVGFLRHTMVVLPALALTASYGLADWSRPAGRPLIRWILLLTAPVITAFFFSHTLVGSSYIGEGRFEARWILMTVTAVAGAAFLLRRFGDGIRLAAVGGAILLSLGFAGWTTRPHPLNVEQQCVLRAVDYLREYDLDRSVVYTGHPWFFFLADRDRYDRVHTPPLRLETLDQVPRGGVLLWENHYGDRPGGNVLWGNVPLETLVGDERFRMLFRAEASYFKLVLFQRKW